MESRYLWRALVALLAVALVLAVAGIAVPKWRQAQASAKAAERCATIATESAARNAVVNGAGHLRVTVLGDSYAQGYLMAHPARSWPSRLVGPLHARVTVRSLGGTGFVASPCGPSSAYPNRVGSVRSTRPNVVVIEGGLNDVLASPQAITTGLRRTVAGLRGVRVVVVGPAAAPRWHHEAAVVDQTLARAAAAAGVQYVSTYRWPLTFAGDRIHLTEESQRLFGDHVAAVIAR